jgi:hypothetical protein
MSKVWAVVSASPSGWRGVARFGRFADFQRQVGELGAPEAQGWWGGHAVCHALMNGVARVVYVGVAADDLRDPARACAALTQAAGAGPLDGAAIPGDWGLSWAQAVAARWPEVCARGGWSERARLWLDAPDDAHAGPSAPQGVLRFAQALTHPEAAPSVSVVGPWVPTQSPGCWREARLPGSCLVGPLWLGVASHLRGAHGLPAERRLDPATQAAFEAAGAGWLWAAGARALVRLQTPAPLPPEVISVPVTLDERIRAALEEATAQALTQGAAQGPRLWKQLERRAYSALMAFAAAGELVAFDVRCDADTNDGSAQPVIAVHYKTPARVQRLSIRLNALA